MAPPMHDFEKKGLTKEESEDQKKKRMERFGPVDEHGLAKQSSMDECSTGQQKRQIKCKHWPKCKNTNETCEYFHPTETCKYFPKCQFGEHKCMYIHPEISCKFGDSCTRVNCAYKHSQKKQAAQQMLMMNPLYLLQNAFGAQNNTAMIMKMGLTLQKSGSAAASTKPTKSLMPDEGKEDGESKPDRKEGEQEDRKEKEAGQEESGGLE